MINVVRIGKRGYVVERFENIEWKDLYNYLDEENIDYEPDKKEFETSTGGKIIVY